MDSARADRRPGAGWPVSPRAAGRSCWAAARRGRAASRVDDEPGSDTGATAARADPGGHAATPWRARRRPSDDHPRRQPGRRRSGSTASPCSEPAGLPGVVPPSGVAASCRGQGGPPTVGTPRVELEQPDRRLRRAPRPPHADPPPTTGRPWSGPWCAAPPGSTGSRSTSSRCCAATAPTYRLHARPASRAPGAQVTVDGLHGQRQRRRYAARGYDLRHSRGCSTSPC